MKHANKLIIGLATFCTAIALAQQPAEPIDSILRDLASPDFAAREAAQKRLNELGPSQYDGLQKRAMLEKDEEVRSRLEAKLDAMPWERMHAQATRPLRAGGHITGRVVDSAGQPIAGAIVQAQSGAWGDGLWWAIVPHVASDAMGCFDLEVPFSDIYYQVQVVEALNPYEEPRSRSHEKDILVAGATSIGDIEVENNAQSTVKGILLDSNNQPVANQKLEVVGQYGARTTTATNEHGEFTVTSAACSLGNSMVVIQAGNMTVPVKILGNRAMQLTMVPAGTLSGIVSANKKPLAGAKVFARPLFIKAPQFETSSAADGSYKLTCVPPGEYIVTAETPKFGRLLPFGGESQLPTTAVRSGEAISANLELDEMAAVDGIVFDENGRPVPDAVVGIVSNLQGVFRDPWRAVQCDEDGRFTVATKFTANSGVPSGIQLVAYSALHGRATQELGKLAAGELRRMNIKLPGSIRIAGTINDGEGKPVTGVKCLPDSPSKVDMRSGPDGRFDLGQISRRGEGPMPVYFRSMRPMSPQNLENNSSLGLPVASREAAPVFYARKMIFLEPGKPADKLKIAMKQVQLLQINGTLLSAQGKPVANATAFLLTGDVKVETWAKLAEGMEREGGIVDAIYSSKTDAQGGFTLWTVREDLDSLPLLDIGRDFSRFSVGVIADTQLKLVEKVEIPSGGALDLKVQLEK